MLQRIEGFRVDARKVPFAADEIDRQLLPLLAEYFQSPPERFAPEYRIFGKSVDARRGAPELIYHLAVDYPELLPGAAELTDAELAERSVRALPPSVPEPAGPVTLRNPLIVGAGPAGLFAAYYLALLGCAPLVLERGEAVPERTRTLERFLAARELDCESNFLFGAGGAGTFSDGKLYTRVHDPRADWVFAGLLAAGAPPDTAYCKRPHLGSDGLKRIVPALMRKIEAAGGSFRFGCRVAAPLVRNGRCLGVKLADGETVGAPAVLFAHGLSARELTLALTEAVPFALKGFQIGCRVEHLQEWVDFRQFRTSPRPACLGAAEYQLMARRPDAAPGMGVTTFCMCPGGEIIPATAWQGSLSTNGMSLRAREGRFANAAVITTLPETTFASPQEAYAFLQDLERRSCQSGGGDYTFPAQSVASFVRGGKPELAAKEASPVFGVRPAAVRELLPKAVAGRLADGMRRFEKLMPGFMKGSVIGTESCVSSPVRLLRDPETLQCIPGLYAAGEGAGYAGGIVSAAIDGVKAAEKMAVLSGTPGNF